VHIFLHTSFTLGCRLPSVWFVFLWRYKVLVNIVQCLESLSSCLCPFIVLSVIVLFVFLTFFYRTVRLIVASSWQDLVQRALTTWRGVSLCFNLALCLLSVVCFPRDSLFFGELAELAFVFCNVRFLCQFFSFAVTVCNVFIIYKCSLQSVENVGYLYRKKFQQNTLWRSNILFCWTLCSRVKCCCTAFLSARLCKFFTVRPTLARNP